MGGNEGQSLERIFVRPAMKLIRSENFAETLGKYLMYYRSTEGRRCAYLPKKVLISSG
ncbi:hypothetical protein NXC24_PC00137 (plasmid) [Rhizobium sp. NXC24]|nr:hypothetical protein NXC24_PC00137 [Rhizobium sp. NXC24]